MLAQALAAPFFEKRQAPAASSGFSALLQSLGISVDGKINATEKSALTLSAFYNGINIICNDYAKLPKGIYKKTSDGTGREKLSNHPLKYIINTRPNQYMIAYMFDSMLLQDALLKGNGYAIIDRNPNSAQPIALQYVNQDETTVEVKIHNNKLFYTLKPHAFLNPVNNDTRVERTISANDILHIPGFSFNGITGIGVVRHAANSLGVPLSAQTFAGEYYDGKGVGTGVLTVTKKMDDDAKTRYSTALSAMFATKAKWVVPVIDEASNFEHLKITPQEAQFLLANENGINEVARWLNLNPSKLKQNKDINNSISESLQIQHVSDSILPWAIKIEQEYGVKLLSQQEIKSNHYFKFNTDSLLTADVVAQADAFMKEIYSGTITPNEVRALKDRNPIVGLDQPLIPANLQTLEQVEAKLKLTESQSQN